MCACLRRWGRWIDVVFGKEGVGVWAGGRGEAEGHWLVGEFAEDDDGACIRGSVGGGVEQIADGSIEEVWSSG